MAKNTTNDNSRQGIIKRFRAQIARGEPIIGGGAGTGISAKSEEAGGIDLLIVYNSGRYRMAGRGSTAGLMPYGNANQIVKEMAFEIIPVVKHTPVLAGVCGTDPFMMPKLFLRELQEFGYAGIQNFPTVGLIEGELRSTLEETGMGYGLEVDCVRLAHSMDMLTTPYCFNTDEAIAMTKAGADIVVAHMGCTSGGSIGAKSVKTPASCVKLIQAIVDAAKKVRKDVICLCHGGPIAMPADAQYIMDHVEGIDGFYGASSTERLPTEIAIKKQIEDFKALHLPARKASGGRKAR
jgi:predicted TIM-barrel enzyme